MTGNSPDTVAAHVCDTGNRLLLELGDVFLLRYLEHRRFLVIGNCTLPVEDEILVEAQTSFLKKNLTVEVSRARMIYHRDRIGPGLSP